jgi:hypothetical protein
VNALGTPTPNLDIIEIVKACGVKDVHHLPIGASDDEIKAMIKVGLSEDSLSFLLVDVE